ncbi:DUF2510 domain-containing protein [Nonomuraea terrae]|uniref:DUF2510 domain-containing protein n=1 Tax=Nonomuraea terrae TaxID=2530383 RepID=UPI0037BC1C57
MNTPHPPVQPSPGYYRDPGGQPCLRWWDGHRWTPRTAPLPPHSPAPAPSKGSAGTWLTGIGIAAVLAALGWLIPTAVAIVGDADPVVVVLGGQEVRRDDLAGAMEALSTYAGMEPGDPDSSARHAFCDALPAAFAAKGIEVSYPSGEGSFVGSCVRAR